MPFLHFPPRRLAAACLLITTLGALAGCGALVVGGVGATTAVVATDRRTTGQQVEDQAIELKAGAEMRRLFGDAARVNVIAYGGVVLLTGDVPTAEDKEKAGQAAERVEKVVRVVNELRVGPITTLSVRTNDTWLTSKVKTALLNTKEVPSRTINVTTERGVVYLMGIVTEAEGARAAKVAASVQGVNKVVKLFKIISPESLVEAQGPASATDTPAAPAAPAEPDTTTSPGVEAIPIS